MAKGLLIEDLLDSLKHCDPKAEVVSVDLKDHQITYIDKKDIYYCSIFRKDKQK